MICRLSDKIRKEYATSHIKTVSVINELINNYGLKTDQPDIMKTALKDLYVTDENGNRFYIKSAMYDTTINAMHLYFI